MNVTMHGSLLQEPNHPPPGFFGERNAKAPRTGVCDLNSFVPLIVCWHAVCARMLQAEESHSEASTGPVVALPPCTFAAMFDTYASP